MKTLKIVSVYASLMIALLMIACCIIAVFESHLEMGAMFLIGGATWSLIALHRVNKL